ncbi:MAG: NYN domain-containing protein [Candidatus Harrisonbacteria bacterium]|nr:NYN domain-containing protein [Candidatus Harrisonbacteria bacterium]
MKQKENNFAYIDGANLHKGIVELGRHLNYKRFRVWLSEKYGVGRAYIFHGEIKGNCDAEMVLQAASDMYEKFFDKAVVVTGDGDFACLVNFLKDRKKFEVVMSPSAKKASVLLKRAVPENIVFLERFRGRLEYVRGE